MSNYNNFLKERIEIGAGMVARIYSWNGYAYKCFREGYPQEWIEYELKQQKEICKSELPIPQYYISEFPYTIKMDLITGVTMFEQLKMAGKKAVLDDFVMWFQKIHIVQNLELHNLAKYLLGQIDNAPADEVQKAYARKCVDDIEQSLNEKTVLCHMDYHVLNVMYDNSSIQIIDWVNAKNGKPIWDYARTYVIFYEYAAGLKRNYMKRVMSQEGYSEEIFMKAVYANAICRLTEHDTKRVRQLIQTTCHQY